VSSNAPPCSIACVADGTLLCPSCGEDCGLHHGRITIYQRREDQSHVVRTIVDSAVTSNVVIGNTNNPSRRRHGLAIEFSCEQCGGVGELTIAQHKS
jgi:hypothetical protein